MKTKRFHGVIPPLLTPLLDDESVDEAGLRRLIEHLIGGGVHGIFILGSSGEGPLLDPVQRRRVVDVAGEAIGGRVPLLVGVSDCSVSRVRRGMAELVSPRVDAFVVTLPYYGVFPDAPSQIRFFRQVADASPRPVVIYNIPPAVHANIEPETIAQLASHPNIAALKDSYGDLARFHRTRLLCEGQGLALFQGSEVIAGSSLLVGADGLVSGLGNLVPHWVVELYQASQAGDWAAVNRAQERLLALWMLHHHGHWLGCLKMAASLLGLCGPAVSSPISSPSAEGTERIRQILATQGLL